MASNAGKITSIPYRPAKSSIGSGRSDRMLSVPFGERRISTGSKTSRRFSSGSCSGQTGLTLYHPRVATLVGTMLPRLDAAIDLPRMMPVPHPSSFKDRSVSEETARQRFPTQQQMTNARLISHYDWNEPIERKCFVGSECVPWMVRNGFGADAKDAVRRGQAMMDEGLIIWPGAQRMRFLNTYILYRWQSGEKRLVSPRPAESGLDMTYIAGNLLALRMPSERGERQRCAQLLRRRYSGASCRIYDLTENESADGFFGLDVRHFPFKARTPPPLMLLCSICRSMEQWLDADPRHVAVVTAQGGMDRVATIISAFTMYKYHIKTDDAFAWFQHQRLRGARQPRRPPCYSPSQKRFVRYLEEVLIQTATTPQYSDSDSDSSSESITEEMDLGAMKPNPHHGRVFLRSVKLINASSSARLRPSITVESYRDWNSTSRRPTPAFNVTTGEQNGCVLSTEIDRSKRTSDKCVVMRFKQPIELKEQTLLTFRHQIGLQSESMFSCWLHTAFLEPCSKTTDRLSASSGKLPSIVLPLGQLDDVNTSVTVAKSGSRVVKIAFPSEFQIKLTFGHLPAPAPTLHSMPSPPQPVGGAGNQISSTVSHTRLLVHTAIKAALKNTRDNHGHGTKWLESLHKHVNNLEPYLSSRGMDLLAFLRRTPDRRRREGELWMDNEGTQVLTPAQLRKLLQDVLVELEHFDML